VTIEDVGNAAAFLCSDLAAGISGEVLYVDGGYRTVGHELSPAMATALKQASDRTMDRRRVNAIGIYVR